MRESRTSGSVRAKAEWLRYSTILREEGFAVYLRQEVLDGKPTQSGCCRCDYRIT